MEHEFDDNIDGVPITANYSWTVVPDYGNSCDTGRCCFLHESNVVEYFEICDEIDNDCDDLYWISSSKYSVE